MSKFGFSDSIKEPPAIELPKPAKSGKKPDKAKVAKAVAAGKDLGFVSREGQGTVRRTGRKRTEPQGKLLIAGPERVIEQFRAYCDQEGVSYWAGLEVLLNGEVR